MQPLFYFPSTLIAVDDHRDSLTALHGLFEPFYPFKTFHKPQEALKFLQNYVPPLSSIPSLKAMTEGENVGLLDSCPVDFNVLDIAQLADLPNRQQEISVLIIDFNMPELNGLELCKKLKHLPMKKILLTGENTYREALLAFNEQIIDSFLQKESPTLGDELLESAQFLTQQYFFEKSQSLLTHLEANKPLPLSDSLFIAFFENWRKENNITEYYLIDKTGSFLCITKQGEKRHFIMHTESSLKEFAEFNEGEAGQIVPELFQALYNHQKIPFFGVGQLPLDTEYENWGSCFYPARLLEGRERYWWAIG